MFATVQTLAALLVLLSSALARAGSCAPQSFTVTNFELISIAPEGTSLSFDLASPSAGTAPTAHCSTPAPAQGTPAAFSGTCDSGARFGYVRDGNLTVAVPRVCDGNHDEIYAAGPVALQCNRGREGPVCVQVGEVVLFVQGTIQV